jgi:2-isopropylmalate synthase
MKRRSIELYDTTLRDGSQMEGISYSVEDKLRIAERLDAFGLTYIEGGWPGSNPKDMAFFRRVRTLQLKRAKVTAFGSTRRAAKTPGRDANLRALLKAETGIVTIFGKSWDLHVQTALRVSLAHNLQMIESSVAYLKKRGRMVIYDAEHFFDGYHANPEYALQTVQVATDAGADRIVLCDTNGGSLTSDVTHVVEEVCRTIKTPLGIHAHNDSNLAVANTVASVVASCTHVQGTINGYGERCGNADLTSVIPVLQLKMGVRCVSDKQLAELTELSRFVSDVSNMAVKNNHPFVGESAFAHKGGVHVSAVLKSSRTYEHIDPTIIGNQRRFPVSELAGGTGLAVRAQTVALQLPKGSKESKKLLKLLQRLEHDGYHFEAADASFELLLERELKKLSPAFALQGFRVVIEKEADGHVVSEATVKVQVRGEEKHTVAEGDGPVNALDNALRKALEDFYPTLAQMQLADFKVRVLDERAGTASKVRVLIRSHDPQSSWGTIGVSENIIEASWEALVDSVEYKLLKDRGRKSGDSSPTTPRRTLNKASRRK